MGLRFSTGPLALPGFCNGMSNPLLISSGYVPVSAILFRISLMCSYKQGAYFKCSDLILSIPELLLFFKDFMAVAISSVVNGFFSF